MAARVRDILLRIRGDASDAENDLHQLARELKAFDGTTATATVDINAAAAERKLKSAQDAVKAFGRLSESAKIDLQDQAAKVKLQRLQENLAKLQARETSPKIDLAIGATIAKIERVEAELDKLDRRRVNVNVDVDRHGTAGRLGGALAGGIAGGIGAAAQGLGTAAGVLGNLVAAATRGIPILGQLGGVIATLGVSAAALGPIMLVLIPIIGVLLLHAVIMLTGAFVALGASMAAAAAGVGVLAVALAGAFGPVLLVAIAAMARFAKIIEAVKAATDGAAAASRKVRDAHEAQVRAQQNAADTAERVSATTTEAYRAWAQAAEDVSDAIRGIAQAELSRDQARLNVAKAEQDLKDFREETGLTADSLDGLFKKFTDISYHPQDLIGAIRKSAAGQAEGVDPLDLAQKILDVRQARLNEQDAIDGVSDAHTRLDDARAREQEFLENGIAAYEPYTAAVQANADAQTALAEAAERVNDAQKDRNKEMAALSPIEQRLARTLVGLKTALTDLFAPAVRGVFRGLLDALKDVSDFAKDPRVRSGFTEIGDALGDVFRTMGRELRRRETRDTFKVLADGADKLIHILGTDVFRSVFRILLRIARDAMPYLIDVARDVARFLRRIAGDGKGIDDFVKTVTTSFRIWRRVAKDLWDIIKEFFGDARDSGDKLGRRIHRILTDFRDWLRENPDAIKNFFKESADFAGKLIDALPQIVEAFQTIADLADKISTAVDAIQKPGEIAGKVIFGSGERLGVTQDAIESTIRLAKNPQASAAVRAEARRTLHAWGIPGYQRGGLVLGSGLGDSQIIAAEPGEFMLRRSVAQAIGIGRLNLLNTGALRTLAPAGAGVHVENINLPPAPGHSQMGDARHQAVMLARELRRRGGQGLGGGGVQ